MANVAPLSIISIISENAPLNDGATECFTINQYLMQFQADIANTKVDVPEIQEISAMGAACLAGLTVGLYSQEQLAELQNHSYYDSKIDYNTREKLQAGWKKAVEKSLL